jgi:hypothetical protein
MVPAMGYLLRVSPATKTQPPKPRASQRRATGMAARTRDLHRVKTSATAAEKLAPKGVETLARIVAASGDPNVPSNPHAVARAGARNAQRVLARELGGRWLVEPAA